MPSHLAFQTEYPLDLPFSDVQFFIHLKEQAQRSSRRSGKDSLKKRLYVASVCVLTQDSQIPKEES